MQKSANDPQKGDIQHIDGHECYYTEGFWIRRDLPPEGHDLQTTMKLVRAFEKRFQKAVESGMETTADTDRIERQKAFFHRAVETKTAIAEADRPAREEARLLGMAEEQKAGTGQHSREYKKACSDEQVFGGMLAVSLYHRVVTNIQHHLHYRILEQAEDTAALEKLKPVIERELGAAFSGSNKLKDGLLLDKLWEAIERDYAATTTLLKYVRRSGGKEDRDDVLKEMVGEPMALFSATLTASPEPRRRVVAAFYNRRCTKIARCWKNIDDATRAVKKLIARNPRLRDSDLPGIIDNFSASAKDRCEMMRSDPDFDETAGHLRSNRNQLREFEMPDINVSVEDRECDARTMKLVDKYRKLVYDLAHVRTYRDVSTDELVARIDKELMIPPARIAPQNFSGSDKRGRPPRR